VYKDSRKHHIVNIIDALKLKKIVYKYTKRKAPSLINLSDPRSDLCQRKKLKANTTTVNLTKALMLKRICRTGTKKASTCNDHISALGGEMLTKKKSSQSAS
jgi:hypothetical protein